MTSIQYQAMQRFIPVQLRFLNCLPRFSVATDIMLVSFLSTDADGGRSYIYFELIVERSMIWMPYPTEARVVQSCFHQEKHGGRCRCEKGGQIMAERPQGIRACEFVIAAILKAATKVVPPPVLSTEKAVALHECHLTLGSDLLNRSSLLLCAICGCYSHRT